MQPSIYELESLYDHWGSGDDDTISVSSSTQLLDENEIDEGEHLKYVHVL